MDYYCETLKLDFSSFRLIFGWSQYGRHSTHLVSNRKYLGGVSDKESRNPFNPVFILSNVVGTSFPEPIDRPRYQSVTYTRAGCLWNVSI